MRGKLVMFTIWRFDTRGVGKVAVCACEVMQRVIAAMHVVDLESHETDAGGKADIAIRRPPEDAGSVQRGVFVAPFLWGLSSGP